MQATHLSSYADTSLEFSVPPELEAHEPPEFRGVRRDQVRMLVLPRREGPLSHTRFGAIGDYLRRGDLLVMNNSRTIPGLLRARDQSGDPIEVRLAHRRSDHKWDALLLEGKTRVGRKGMLLDFGKDLYANVQERRSDLPFLWHLEFNRCCLDLLDHIYRLGEPVRYTYVKEALPIDLYQTVYAAEPGSVEMPSAGRAFTWELLIALKRLGIGIEYIMLHTGLSSTRDDDLDASHPNYDEEYIVPESTAQKINGTHRFGGRVVAVGTSVVRALETIAREDGTMMAGEGWTRLHIDGHTRLKTVDGLVTGFHEPKASHLDLLCAFVNPSRLELAYSEAIRHGYLWHEFGDINLIV